MKLRCQSHQPAKINPPTVEQPEEMSILYSKVMCTVVGTILINSLRSCKNQLARSKYRNFIKLNFFFDLNKNLIKCKKIIGFI